MRRGKNTRVLSSTFGVNNLSIEYLAIMPTDNRLLRKYIRESLTLELGLNDVSSVLLGNTQLSKGRGGIQKWFANFLSRQLDKAGEKIDIYLGQKLDSMMPDEVKQKLAKYEKTSGIRNTSSENLAKVVSAWMSETEDLLKKDFSSAEEKQIADFAAREYAEALKNNSDVPRALLLVKKKLDMKYGTSLSKSPQKTA